MTKLNFAAALALIFSSGAAAAFSSPSTSAGLISDAIGDLYRATHYGQVAISPDGSQVAWIANGALYVELTRGGEARRIEAAGDHEFDSDIAWSPDSHRLAFLSDAGRNGEMEIYISDPGRRRTRLLTHVTGDLSSLHWSPDGRQIAFLFIENAPRTAGPLAPMTPPSGVIESEIFEQRLALADVNTGSVRQLSPADMYVYEYDWSPAGDRFVISAAHGAGDANWWLAQLFTLSAAGGAPQFLYRPPLQVAEPRWSPDGERIAFIGGIMSDEGITGGDLFELPAVGGRPRNLTAGIKETVNSFTWTPAGSMVVVFNDHGRADIQRIGSATSPAPATAASLERLWEAPESVLSGGWPYSVSLARDGNVSAVIRESFSRPPAVWAGPLGHWTQLTHDNDSLQPDSGRVEDLHWTSDGRYVQGWLIYPRNFDPHLRYPMIVVVHGGPAAAARPSWPGSFFNSSVFSTAGYFVFEPNPRGSNGGGEAFEAANVKDFGYGDLRDIMRGVDAAAGRAPIDLNRLGITGWSYGGYMTMWAVTQTHRFKAAVAGAGIANWLSYYGENDIDQWMIPYFGASVYRDPAVYARSAPITFITHATTPTLVLVGDRDGECPTPQSFEFWHALKSLGTTTQLVVYPDEGHYIRFQQHQRDIINRSLHWFNTYLNSPAAAP
jgi:dipeptidyl aminopeptidase/acylaminoacyl peptidase